ncbi:ABC transporter permease [Candidatus Pacearchaeota archaeon]|nr:ABC transporter permease [Candidatus Pacearchaeota archaeon]
MLKDFFFLGLNNLKRRKVRSWLTMIGIFIGIAAVVGLISLGQGLQDYINEQFEILGGDKIIIEPKNIGPPGSATSKNLILTSKDLEVVRDVKGVSKAEGIIMKSGVVTLKDEINVVFTLGMDEGYFELFENLGNFEVIEGKELTDNDKYKVVVGYNHAHGDIWDKPAQLRDTITVEDVDFKVIGIRGKIGNPFDDNAISIPKETLKEILNIEDEESQIIVKTEKGFDPETVAKDIERRLRASRNEKEDQETFDVTTSEQLLETFQNIFMVVQGVLVGIAAISLLVGGIGIMNTMYTSVLERTKEIGTMKAIGAKNSHILTLFLIESGLLGLMGGIIGVILGISLAKAAEYVAGIYIGSPLLHASLNPLIIIGALAFSFIIGTLSGVLPAMQAARLRPADALRYE